LTFQHTLIRVVKSVFGPGAVPTISNLRANQRVNMKSPRRKYLSREAGDFFCVFGESRTYGNLRILRKTAKPSENRAIIQLDESETLPFQKRAFCQLILRQSAVNEFGSVTVAPITENLERRHCLFLQSYMDRCDDGCTSMENRFVPGC